MIRKFNNILPVCKECIKERRIETQKNIEDKLKQGLNKEIFYIKKGFPVTKDSDKKEYMWVKVNSINFDERVCHGVLDNEPIDVDYIKLGDKVSAEFQEIVEILCE